jgi:hypothetical protein
MSSWDTEELSRRFVRLAQQADDRKTECRQRVASSPAHKLAHDEALAEFYVYNRLHGRTFLETPAALVEELRFTKNLDFKNGSRAYDPERFERRRINLTDELIAEFSKKI